MKLGIAIIAVNLMLGFVYGGNLWTALGVIAGIAVMYIGDKP